LIDSIEDILENMQTRLFEKAQAHLVAHTHTIASFADFTDLFTPQNANKPEIHGGFAKCFAVDSPELDNHLKPLKVSARCIPLEQSGETGQCIFTGEKTDKQIIFAKSY
jgi:prolyl-tRNA synthetase